MSDQTRWLNQEEYRLWRLMLAAFRKIEHGMDETLNAGGAVSTPEFAVLVALTESSTHSLRLRELCAELEWDRSRASHQVTRMERRGLVVKEKSAGDGRGVVVSVTEEGIRRLENAAPEHVESVRRMVFDHLDYADAAILQDYFASVVAVDNIPGYPGFEPDDLLRGGQSPAAGD